MSEEIKEEIIESKEVPTMQDKEDEYTKLQQQNESLDAEIEAEFFDGTDDIMEIEF